MTSETSDAVVRRKLTLEGYIDRTYPDGERISWDELWMSMAQLVSARGKCARDRVGAVVVSSENEMLAVGYNGPPKGLPTDGPCSNWCPRAIAATSGDALDPVYSDCYALHAETNALLRTPDKPLSGGSIYVSSSTCWQCATMIANTGVSRLVMRVKPSHRYRNPEKVVDYLTEAGIEVVVWGETTNKYRAVFVAQYGIGPHTCHFCDVVMPWPEAIHHLDHDHSNNAPDNLTAAHLSCHSRYHSDSGAKFSAGGARTSVTTKWERRKPLLPCGSCDLITTPGWLKRHSAATGHDGSAYSDWIVEVEKSRAEKTWPCDSCGKEFETAGARGLHWRARPEHRPREN